MLGELSIGELVLLAAALGLAGVLTGFLSGLFGIGGGGVLVPVLYETFSVVGVDPAIRMQMALGTSLLVMAPTSIRTYAGHRARGNVDEAFLRRIVPFVVLGVAIGLLIASLVNSNGLKLIWAVAGTLLAGKMFFGKDHWRLGPDIPASRWVEIYVMAVGTLSILKSIGGGAYITMLLTLYGRPLLAAIATSSGVAPFIAIPGALGFAWAGYGHPGLPPLSIGFASFAGAALIVPAGLLAAPLGVRLAHGIAKRTLELAFATFLLLVSVRFMVSLATG